MVTPPENTTADQGPPARSAAGPGAGDGVPDAERAAPAPAPGSAPVPPAGTPRVGTEPANATTAATASATGPTAEANGQRAESRAARRSSHLPRRPDRLIAWLAALACLAVAAVPLSVGLFAPDTLHPLEADALARSTQTWQQQVELPAMPGSVEPWVPIHDEQPQLSHPPGGTWLHLLAFRALDADATADDRLTQGRLVAMAMALLTIAAVFWAAMSIGGLLPATLAGVIAASLPVLLFYGRIANEQLAPTALVTLAVAAAIWALRPLRPANHLVRQALGWALCGLLLGLATLTGGLPATVAVLLPLGVILILCPNRLSHALGLLAAILIGAVLTTPWTLHVHEQDPGVWRHWAGALLPAGVDETWPDVMQRAGQRLGLLLLMALPWTAWLIAGLLQPFSTSSAGARTRLFIGWTWFVTVFLLVLLLPGRGGASELLLVLPPAALVVAQVIRQFRELAAEGRAPRIWSWLCWPHVMALLAVSVAAPAAMHFQPWLVAQGWLAQPVAAPMHPLYWLGMAACLILLVGLSLRFMLRRYPGKATICWALWTMLAFTAVIYPTAHGPLMQDVPATATVPTATPAFDPRLPHAILQARAAQPASTPAASRR